MIQEALRSEWKLKLNNFHLHSKNKKHPAPRTSEKILNTKRERERKKSYKKRKKNLLRIEKLVVIFLLTD